MKRVRVAGDLETAVPVLEERTLLASLLAQSPELKSARSEVERAEAALQYAKSERVPNLFLRGGIGYNNERLDDDRKVGAEVFVEAGVTLPLFDRNQGNIAAAEAELAIATHETRRLELAVRARHASAFRDYNVAINAVRRYREVVLPRARTAYDLYLASFSQMAAAYPQVLIAQRTMFQVRENYISALVDLWQSATRIQGFLLAGGLEWPAKVEGTGAGAASERQISDN